MEISFVILTWNSEKTIGECLQAIITKCSQENISSEILVVDNGSTDRTAQIISDDFHNYPFQLIRLKENMGTTFSRNLAFKRAKGDIICVLDSDAVILTGSLKSIVSLLNDPEIGLVAPKLVLSDGTIQNSVKKFPSLFSKLMKIPRIIFKIRTYNYDFYDNFPFYEKKEVDTAISACWFFRRNLLDEVGYLDELIFYSPEDVDYCLRIRKHGKRILYFPDFTVLHYTQHITHKKAFSKTSISHFRDLLYYYYKHGYIVKPKLK